MMKRDKSAHDDSEALNSQQLADEFFGNGALFAPGEDSEGDGTTGLVRAIAGSVRVGGAKRGDGSDVPGKGEAQEVYRVFDQSQPKQDFGPDYTKRRWFEPAGKDNPELNPYVAEQDKRYAMDKRAVKLVRLVVLVVVSYVLFAVLLPSPSYNVEFSYTFAGIVSGVQDNVAAFFDMLGGRASGSLVYKMCTYAIYAFAGAALAVTGAVYQGSLKNALASPTTLGVNAGGTLGVALFVLFAPAYLLDPLTDISNVPYYSADQVAGLYQSFDLGEYLLVTQGSALSSVLGCFVVVGLVMLVAHLVGRGSSTSYAIIICGQVVALVASAVIDFARYYLTETDPTDARSSYISSMQAGSISAVSTPLDLALVAIPCAVGIAIVILMRRRLNLLAFNDEEARSMGLSAERMRWLMVGTCTFITAVVISFCGNIGFVGFSVPLIVRRYVGPDFTYLIPTSVAMGSLFMIVSYWLTDLNLVAWLDLGIPVSINMITSTVGIVLFVFATVQQRRSNRSADWL